MSESLMVADVTIWLYSKYEPIVYQNVLPYHEAEFYCMRHFADGSILKIPNRLIEQIKEDWHE